MKDLLSHTNVFINLSPKTVEEIAAKVEVKKFKKGDLVLEKEILNDSLFVIARGRVEILMTVRDKEVKMAELGPAEAFGEMSFIDNFITSARVRAMEDTQVGQLHKRDILAVLRHDPAAASKFWETLCQILIRRYWVLLEQTYKIFKEYFKTHEKL